jgi:hypothetical protein
VKNIQKYSIIALSAARKLPYEMAKLARAKKEGEVTKNHGKPGKPGEPQPAART